MTSTSVNYKLGLLLVVTAVFFWGILPVGLKLATNFTDAVTLTWMRFGVACVVTLAFQLVSGGLAGFKALTAIDWFKLVLAGLLLIVNYNTFVWGLDYIPLGSAQLNFQVAPFFLVFGGVLFYGDKVKGGQWLCLVALAIGMVLFFHPHLQPAAVSDGEVNAFMGMAFVTLSALSWSVYALIQKSLLSKISPQNVLLVIYAQGVVVMWPAVDGQSLQGIDAGDWLVLAFCCANTLVAYGSFAQAMKHLDTVQVSAMVALTPLVSFGAAMTCAVMLWWPETIKRPDLDVLSLLGIFIVLAAAVMVQLLRREKPVAVTRS